MVSCRRWCHSAAAPVSHITTTFHAKDYHIIRCSTAQRRAQDVQTRVQEQLNAFERPLRECQRLARASDMCLPFLDLSRARQVAHACGQHAMIFKACSAGLMGTPGKGGGPFEEPPRGFQLSWGLVSFCRPPRACLLAPPSRLHLWRLLWSIAGRALRGRPCRCASCAGCEAQGACQLGPDHATWQQSSPAESNVNICVRLWVLGTAGQCMSSGMRMPAHPSCRTFCPSGNLFCGEDFTVK